MVFEYFHAFFLKEAQLEVEVVKILNQSGAEMFIPAFARHRVTMKALSAFTEEDLQKVISQKFL